MRNNIKFSASFLIIILSIMFSFVASAQEDVGNCVSDTGKVMTHQRALEIAKASDCAKVGEFTTKYSCNKNLGGLIDVSMNPLDKPNCALVCRVSIDKETAEEGWMCTGTNIKKEQGPQQNKIKNDRKDVKEVQNIKLQSIIQNVKEKREAYREKITTNKEGAKIKIETAKNNFKQKLTVVKDDKKKISAENILNTIQKLNTKMTDILADKVNQIENVLISIDSRIIKAENKGIDVSNVKVEVLKAKELINKAQDLVALQAEKVYEVNITSEAELKVEMKKLRDTFTKDIKAVKDAVKAVDAKVRSIAVLLAQIPKIDVDQKETENSTSVDSAPVVVEDNTVTNNN